MIFFFNAELSTFLNTNYVLLKHDDVLFLPSVLSEQLIP